MVRFSLCLPFEFASFEFVDFDAVVAGFPLAAFAVGVVEAACHAAVGVVVSVSSRTRSMR